MRNGWNGVLNWLLDAMQWPKFGKTGLWDAGDVKIITCSNLIRSRSNSYVIIGGSREGEGWLREFKKSN